MSKNFDKSALRVCVQKYLCDVKYCSKSMMIYFFLISYKNIVAQDRAVRMATSYILDSTGIESRWGAAFSTPIQADPVIHPA